MTSSFKPNWSSVRQLAGLYDYFIFDCDGVVWHGDEIHIGQAFRNIEWLESLGKKVFFVTNNSSISREAMMAKMENKVFGYQNAHVDKLYPSCTIAAQYVKQNMPDCKKVRYIGMEPMGEELRSNGLITTGGTDEEAYYKGDYFTYE